MLDEINITEPSVNLDQLLDDVSAASGGRTLSSHEAFNFDMNNLNNFAVSPMQSKDGFSKKFFIAGDKMYQSLVTERIATEVSAKKL